MITIIFKIRNKRRLESWSNSEEWKRGKELTDVQWVEPATEPRSRHDSEGDQGG